MKFERERLQHAFERALVYITSLQEADGSWVDWRLPPGESRPWTTAFVGYKLASLPGSPSRNVAPSLEAAAHWLLKNQFDDGGWGYNALAGSDADTTAYAILLLSSSDYSVPEHSYARLLEFQRADGGFATYLPDAVESSWTISHPDVTPVALLGLLTRYSPEERFMLRGIDYVVRQKTSVGLWNSFWWDSFLYATDRSLALLNATGFAHNNAASGEALVCVSPRNAFEAALLVSALLSAGARRDTLQLELLTECVHQLIITQQADGSWKSEPILRVTKRDSYNPWSDPSPGALFADPNRLFTSSMALQALARVFGECGTEI